MNSVTNKYAKNMINSVYNLAPKSEQKVYNFFKKANDTNTQGAALISYYTELNKKPIGNRRTIAQAIENMVENNQVLKNESDKFCSSISKNYPKTAGDRISLAANGSVVDGEVKPKSFFKKLFTVINRLIREE